MPADKTREIIVQPVRNWFYVDWRGILDYRDLLYFLVRKEFIAKYKQTVLGPLWFIVQPIFTTIVFTVIFGKIAKISTEGIPPMLFYLCGLLAWNYFAQCLNSISMSLTRHVYILDKVYFPRLIIPLSIIFSNFFAFLIQLIVFAGFYIYFNFFTSAGAAIHPKSFILFLPVLFLQSAAISLGVGLWIAGFTVKYRDFQHLMEFFTQLWMYLTPIVYPISLIPDRWKWVIAINPMTGIVESYRYAFLGVGTVDIGYLLVSATATCVLLFSGIFFFNKVERTCVDVL